ncbi:Uncharacterised protein [Mycobacteroides abscessus subsp. abscessus]|nr:Uncharacterised protein [Mycobacteroides abscessus subsp. abscessus]
MPENLSGLLTSQTASTRPSRTVNALTRGSTGLKFGSVSVSVRYMPNCPFTNAGLIACVICGP